MQRRALWSSFFALVALAGLAGGADAQSAGGDAACFPACRSGFECRAGRCVATDPEPASCVPACRSGYECSGGQCVAAVPSRQQARAPEPEEPAEPPRFQVALGPSAVSLFFGEGRPKDGAELDMLQEGDHYYARKLAYSARLLIRESASGNAWLALEAGYGSADVVQVEELGYSVEEGGGGGIFLAAEQVQRFPIAGPGYGLALDRRASVDLSLGAYLGKLKTTTEVGGQAGARLSIYWFNVGLSAIYGLETGLGIGLTSGVQAAF